MFHITKESSVEIIEKKSKFITRSMIVSTEEQAKLHIEEIRKNEKGATHNCYAYRILQNNTVIERKNDDGEPGGTAGSPMLSVLNGEDVVNVLVVTTRYFGGIKLGSGGLVNIYKKGVVEVLKKSLKKTLEILYNRKINFKISETHKIEYLLKKDNITILEKNFNGENVIYTILCSKDFLDKEY